MQTKYNKMHKKTNTNTSYFGSLTRISDLNTKSFAIGKVPRRTTPAMVAGLSQADFSHIMSRKVNEDDNVCYEEFYQISRMARDADNSVVTPTTTKKRSRDVNNAATATAASATEHLVGFRRTVGGDHLDRATTAGRLTHFVYEIDQFRIN